MRSLLFCFLFIAGIANAQPVTLGTIKNLNTAHDGYTLFTPLNTMRTLLIDNCGRIVNEWVHDERPGNAIYILDDGSLLRCGESTDTTNFMRGGYGGVVEIYDWNGNNTWYYEYSTTQVRQHHDAHILPNGNVLILAWERRTKLEAHLAGRDTSLMFNEDLWPEQIVEVEPTGDSTGQIVWEWHMWDHLIQDLDPSKANYGVVEDNPQLIDLNYHKNDLDDWIHANGIDYNPQLDQIMISAKNNSELWVIDHSTTTAEAAGHTGGNAGMGGDLLYRWGNPEAYGRGDTTDKKLYDQHNTTWIPQGYPNAGKILYFNNGQGRYYSTVEYLTPPLNGFNYDTLPDGQFGPDTVDYMYQDPVDSTNFYSGFISGAQMLPNGNLLICSGANGYLFEVDSNDTKHWEYINPQGLVTFSQGDTVVLANIVFRAERYTADHPGLVGKDLTPGGYVELDPDTTFCQVYTGIAENNETSIKIYPNPTYGSLNIETSLQGNLSVEVITMDGRVALSTRTSSTTVDVSSLPRGLYLIRLSDDSNEVVARFVKQ